MRRALKLVSQGAVVSQPKATAWIVQGCHTVLSWHKWVSKTHIRQPGEGAVTTMCITPTPLQGQHVHHLLYAYLA